MDSDPPHTKRRYHGHRPRQSIYFAFGSAKPASRKSSFRDSFLQREAVLRLKDDAWSLLVEAKPFDMLLDRIPWSFKTIKHPWMEKLVQVEWR